uniref:Pescadillo homolog n=1 Tax=Palpitomonas bilix TaxID=652834 RepID=A0A7S3G8J5_9EUKA|mmetsp:Transcript_35465/g.92382  ORF Transcript_35465/g.92382 Transcript_35465/m.92382 type:complete len:616 (+) Transcript_35465:74-1921(+)
MGKRMKKGVKGAAANYITRTQAVRKLQLSLKDFRRLCILKGIYPREPSKATKGKNKTYYLTKDILFLSHEPLLQKFRDIKAHMRRVKKAYNRFELTKARKMYRSTPDYNLDHVVKERYPSFTDALRDLDDALTMIHLFATFPTTEEVEVKRVQNCQRLAKEFQYYVLHTNSLKKTFLSLKGIYYQAEVMGETVTWMVPYEFSHTLPNDVDYRVMLTFLEFYETLLDFVNFRLFSSLQLQYPPKLDLEKERQAGWLNTLRLEGVKGLEPATGAPAVQLSKKVKKATGKRMKSLQGKLQALAEKDEKEAAEKGDEDEVEEMEEEDADESDPLLDQSGAADDDKPLFSGKFFFLGREVPRRSLEFVIRSCGGEVAWEDEKESDDRISHYIMDRPTVQSRKEGVVYVQPQWVYDSINHSILLADKEYAPEVVPPPHLSPFVDNETEGYMPDRAKEIERWRRKAQGVEEDEEEENPVDGDEEEEEEKGDVEESEDEMDEDGAFDETIQEIAVVDKETSKPTAEKGGKKKGKTTAAEKAAMDVKDEKERGKMMMTKKQKRLYERMQFGIEKKKAATENLMAKRKAIQKGKKTEEVKEAKKEKKAQSGKASKGKKGKKARAE